MMKINELFDGPSDIVFSNNKSEEDRVPLLSADTQKLQKNVNYEFQYTLSSGLEDAICWWREAL